MPENTSKGSYQGNILRIYLYAGLSGFILFLPIWVIFLQQERGLSLAVVTLTDVAFWFTMAVSEVPTGMVADTLGRKQSILISLALAAAAIVLFATMTTFPLLMVANSLWAIALTFSSGADRALFYESLKQIGKAGQYTRYAGYLSTLRLASGAVASALGGWIGAKDLQLPFLIYAALCAAAFLVVIGIKEPPFEIDEESGKRNSYRQILGITLRAIKERPNLRFPIVYSSFLALVFMVSEILLLQPFAVSIGIPIEMIGLLVFGVRGMRMLGSALADRVSVWIGPWRFFTLAPWMVFAGMAAMGWFGSIWGIVLFSLSGFAINMASPMIDHQILRFSPSAVRATILSISGMLFMFILSMVEPWIGVLADKTGLQNTFSVIAWLPVVVSLPILYFWKRTWEQPTQA